MDGELKYTRLIGHIVVIALLSACDPSTEQRVQHQAELAIAGDVKEKCLHNAHWKEASHYGQLDAIFDGGTRFIVLDVPGITSMNLGDFMVAPIFVGQAASLFNQALGEKSSARFDRSYLQAGSPLSPPSTNEKTCGLTDDCGSEMDLVGR